MGMLISCSVSTLQNFQALLLGRDAASTVADLLKEIDDHLAAAQAPAEVAAMPVMDVSRSTPPICPSCVRGVYMRWAANNDGLCVAVCPECRYSQVIK